MGAHIPAGGAKRPASRETVDQGEHYVRVDGRKEIFAHFLRFTREACDQVLAEARMSLADIDLFITHQGNSNMVRMVLDELGIPRAKGVDNIADHGNTSGATVPIALAEAWESGRIGRGANVLMTSVGAGYTFGAAIHRF